MSNWRTTTAVFTATGAARAAGSLEETRTDLDAAIQFCQRQGLSAHPGGRAPENSLANLQRLRRTLDAVEDWSEADAALLEIERGAGLDGRVRALAGDGLPYAAALARAEREGTGHTRAGGTGIDTRARALMADTGIGYPRAFELAALEWVEADVRQGAVSWPDIRQT